MDSISRLKLAAQTLGVDWEIALEEKAEELEQRNFLRLIPHPKLPAGKIPEFLRMVLGEEPSDDLVKRVEIVPRRRRLSQEEKTAMEVVQNMRCGVCGIVLDKAALPHVDHKVPIALGGSDNVDNMQLLCANCNSGKSALVNWTLGIPYVSRRLTARLRYCVLSRFNSECQEKGCGVNSKFVELFPYPIVLPAYGGRYVFDNLTVLCRKHFDAKQHAIRRRVAHLSLLRKPGTGRRPVIDLR